MKRYYEKKDKCLFSSACGPFWTKMRGGSTFAEQDQAQQAEWKLFNDMRLSGLSGSDVVSRTYLYASGDWQQHYDQS